MAGFTRTGGLILQFFFSLSDPIHQRTDLGIAEMQAKSQQLR